MSNLKEILICWIPNNIEIKGNEKAISIAKLAFDIAFNKVKIPYTDFKHKNNKFSFAK